MTTPPEPQVPIVPVQPYQQAAPAAPRSVPKKGLSSGAIVGIILGGVVLLGVLCCAGLTLVGLADTKKGGTEDNMAVRIEGCSQARGFFRATVVVTNNGTRVGSVSVDIEWLDPGNGERLASTTETVRSVDPGQTAREEAVATGTVDRAAVKCSYRVR